MGNISKSRNGYSHSFISSSVILILMTFLFISFLPEISYADRIWVSFISAKGGSKNGEEGAPPEISIIQSNDAHTLVHVTIPGMWVDTVMGPDGFVYQKLEVPDYAYTNDIGFPELPAIRGLLGIPDNAQVSMIPQVYATQILNNYYVWPHQRPIAIGDEWIFEKNEMFYNSNSWFPLNHNEVGEPGIFKYYTVDNVGYIPFSYNPYLRQLNVSYDYNIDVIYNNGGAIPIATMDEDMANLMRGVIWNFDELNPNIDNYAPVYYLIITPDAYYAEVAKFADWLRTIYPYIIDVVKLSDIGPNPSADDIKNYIFVYYFIHYHFLHSNTDYVLLIGDVNLIQTHIYLNYWYPSEDPLWKYFPSDYWYTLLVGGENDYYPEVAIGRFSFNSPIYNELLSNSQNINELSFQFNKEVNYYSSNWSNNVLLVAHKYDEDKKMDFKNAAEIIADPKKYRRFPFPIFHKSYADDGATNQNVKDKINEGMSSVCYIGHGQPKYWEDWNYSTPPDNNWETDEINSLNNINKLTVVFNYCCQNARINYPDGNCLCEDWMIGGYPDRYIGAVATMGHSRYADWDRDKNRSNFMEEVYKNIYEVQGAKKGLGWIINIASVNDIRLHGSEDPFNPGNRINAIGNAFKRILLGDPALRMRTGRTYSYNENVCDNKNMPDKINNLSNIEVNVNNPVYEDINIYIKSDREENININIYDISGRLINKGIRYKLNEGDNIIDINCDGLNSGVYILNIYSDSFNDFRNVVIVK